MARVNYIECNVPFKKQINLSKTLEKHLTLIADSYKVPLEKIICSLMEPVERYYLRVNILKTTVSETIKALKEQGYQVYEDGKIPEAIYFERKGPYEIEDTKRYVIADKHAADRVMMGANLYVPGVLKVMKAKKGDYVTIITKQGDKVANGYLNINSSDLGKIKKGIAVTVTKSIYKFPKIRELPEYQRGLITDQSYPSMTLLHAIDPPFNAIIADITASPGGKITHAYEYVRGRGKFFAVDHTQKKTERLIENINRLDHNIVVIKGDSRYLHIDYPNFRPSITIVDPPCTGLGNRPKLSLTNSLTDLENLIQLQKQLLGEAIKITRSGGIISYSTCTITRWENEDIVEWALTNYKIELIEPSYPLPLSPLTDYPIGRFTPGIHGTPGFFISLIRKI